MDKDTIMKNHNNRTLKMAAKAARDARLEHEKNHGKPRANTWGGKPDPRTERRIVRREIQQFI